MHRFYNGLMALLITCVMASPALSQTITPSSSQTFASCSALNNATLEVFGDGMNSAALSASPAITVTSLLDTDKVTIAINITIDSGTVAVAIDAGSGTFFSDSYSTSGTTTASTSYDPDGDKSNLVLTFAHTLAVRTAGSAIYTITCEANAGQTTSTLTIFPSGPQTFATCSALNNARIRVSGVGGNSAALSASPAITVTSLLDTDLVKISTSITVASGSITLGITAGPTSLLSASYSSNSTATRSYDPVGNLSNLVFTFAHTFAASTQGTVISTITCAENAGISTTSILAIFPSGAQTFATCSALNNARISVSSATLRSIALSASPTITVTSLLDTDLVKISTSITVTTGSIKLEITAGPTSLLSASYSSNSTATRSYDPDGNQSNLVFTFAHTAAALTKVSVTSTITCKSNAGISTNATLTIKTTSPQTFANCSALNAARFTVAGAGLNAASLSASPAITVTSLLDTDLVKIATSITVTTGSITLGITAGTTSLLSASYTSSSTANSSYDPDGDQTDLVFTFAHTFATRTAGSVTTRITCASNAGTSTTLTISSSAQTFASCSALNAASIKVVNDGVNPAALSASPAMTVTSLLDTDLVSIATSITVTTGSLTLGITAGSTSLLSASYSSSSTANASYDPDGNQSNLVFTFAHAFAASTAGTVISTITCTANAGKPTTSTTAVYVKAFINERVRRLAAGAPDRARLTRNRLDSVWGNSTPQRDAPSYFAPVNIMPTPGGAQIKLNQMEYSSGCLDLWTEGQYAHFSTPSGSKGDFALGFVGIDCQIIPSIMLGFLAQGDWMNDDNASSVTEGTGWMAGPYGTVRLSPNLFLNARAAWGRSDNDIDVAGVTADFNTTRWLVSSQLTGVFKMGNFKVSPGVSVSYVEERQDAYVDSDGIAVAAQSAALGTLNAGPEIARRFSTASGLTIEPQISLKANWEFENSDDLGDLRGIAHIGIIIARANQFSLKLSGNYDGIGLDDYEAWGAQIWLSFPLN